MSPEAFNNLSLANTKPSWLPRVEESLGKRFRYLLRASRRVIVVRIKNAKIERLRITAVGTNSSCFVNGFGTHKADIVMITAIH
jgi:hypothetical protein